MKHLAVFILGLTLVISSCSSQGFFPPFDNLIHQDVERTAAQEELIPHQYKNPFYQNPKIRSILAKTTWFAPGERPVKERETHRIPRKEIFNVLNHAGLLPQSQFI